MLFVAAVVAAVVAANGDFAKGEKRKLDKSVR